MKRIKLLLAIAPLMLLQSCIYGGNDDHPIVTQPYQSPYEAVIMSREQLENSIHLLDPQPVVKSGKIYIKGNYLFVNDVNKGFHIYNYADALNPVPLSFLEVPGATDLSMRGNTLYINQATDLVTLTLDNNAIYMVKRNKDVFPQKVAPDNSYAELDDNEIITDWITL